MTTLRRSWLVTGGAGYIGAHILEQFLAHGMEVAVYDSLYSGSTVRLNYLEKKYKTRISFKHADLRDTDSLSDFIDEIEPYGVIHTAALKSVSESFEKPMEYREVNYLATEGLLSILKSRGIKNFIFSSTAAIYGSPATKAGIEESCPAEPISPYGDSKRLAEQAVLDFLNYEGSRGTVLRFFNVIGRSAKELEDGSKENLVPIILSKIRSNFNPIIFGNDYETHDGTCIRDYIDVRDVASSHLLAAQNLLTIPKILNIGTGKGTSVTEVVEAIQKISNRTDLKPKIESRRPGDPPTLFANVDLARKALGFSAKFSFQESIQSLF